ncbi:radical SAM protein [Streptomyces sp. ME19-01-6]|uniref:radical SAM protein n=1 Tax=Streptomyces sp. ME19-01-6 TaxID=3028686 RepID=UPI0029A835F0|nr:radical SAM protein [Streptomyces sp. ME19-01-6]MDX3225236.1 hypothetical protein [Streptomyces sp. ME19-01-6]
MQMSFDELLEIKTRLLINGVNAQINVPGTWKERTEHLYQHDSGEVPVFSYPQEIVLSPEAGVGQKTVVNVRYRRASPWKLIDRGGQPTLTGPSIGEIPVALAPRPNFYSRKLGTGVVVSQVVQMLGLDALGVIPNNYCAYFAERDECRFCEIEPSYREVGSYPSMRKSVDVISEGLRAALADDDAKHLVITAGNLKKNDRTATVYGDILGRVGFDSSRPVYRFGSLMAPESHERMEYMHRQGLDGVAYNLEFFREDQFTKLAPGKAKYGRKRLMEALEYARDTFGNGHVYTNLVYGVQSWEHSGKPIDFGKENAICLDAVEALLDAGILPLFTIYHTTGKNSMGRISIDEAAAIDFHREYGRLVAASGLVPSNRTGVLFNVSTISNHVYNDAFAAAFAASEQSGRSGPQSG